GAMYSWMIKQLAVGTSERVRLREADTPPDGEALPAWFEARLATLLTGLEAMDVTATWPSWAGPQPGSFYPRRAAHETAMHRWDAEPYDIDPALAVDGV